jgi:hypothetical protein
VWPESRIVWLNNWGHTNSAVALYLKSLYFYSFLLNHADIYDEHRWSDVYKNNCQGKFDKLLLFNDNGSLLVFKFYALVLN